MSGNRLTVDINLADLDAVKEALAAAEAAVASARESQRDRFAMAALTGIIACFRDHTSAQTVPERTRLAYRYADEMIVARDAS